MNGRCSCLREQLLALKDWTEQTMGVRKEQCGMNHIQPMRYFAISQLRKMRAGLRITFIGNSHLFRGTFPRELAKMHFLCCLDRAEPVWCITAENKLKQTTFFLLLGLLMWNLWSLQIAICGTVEEPGGLKCLLEQSVCISGRIFVRLELSTVVLLSPSLSFSPRPCGWLLHVYKSPGTHAYIPERARWVSLARLITITSPRPVGSSQLITKHTLWAWSLLFVNSVHIMLSRNATWKKCM